MQNKILLLLTFIVINIAPVLAQLTIGSTVTPNAGALVDLNYTATIATTYQGVLLPQIALNLTSDYGLNIAVSTVAINGMLVYNIAMAGTGATTVIAGTYIWQDSTLKLINVGAIAEDNIGNHTATKDLNLVSNIIVGTADKITNGAIGVGITTNGGINIGVKHNKNMLIDAQADHTSSANSQNQFIGIQSWYSNIEGHQKKFSGHQNVYSNTNGNNNQFSGYLSGYYNTTGWANFFSG